MGNEATKKKQEQTSAEVVAINEKPIRHVGSDDGHFGIKIVTEDAEGKMAQYFVPSRVAEGASLISLGESENSLYQVQDGRTYTVSASLPHVDTRFSGYAYSDINRVLNHHALIVAGLAGEHVSVVTGLPVADYFAGSVPNEEFIERKVKNLLDNPVENRNDNIKCAKIVAHSVQAEAIAAFYDLLINADGSINQGIQELVESGSIAIIDIGGKTTDFAVVVNGGTNIDPTRSGTSPLGALSLNEAVYNALKLKFKVDALTPVQVDRAVMTGTLRAFGKDNDCSEIVKEEKTLLASQIIEATKRKMRDGADLERVFFVGGGSLLLKDQLKDLYPHAEFVADPQFSNGRGMFKIAKYMIAE